LYLKAEIREIPTKFILNRHSGLLPKYGGVWPVFYSLVNNESVIGVTLHLVTSKIDSGKIAAQKMIKVNQRDSLFKLYEKTFMLSGQCVLDAINYCEKEIKKLSKEKEINFNIDYTNTMPSNKDWKTLRQNGFRFI
jgi:methionyl-tRNA formyltransferase